MSKFEPNEQVYVRFKPFENSKVSLANKSFSLYPDDFRLLIGNYQASGRKILIVTDRIHNSDLISKEIASGNEGGVYANVLKWAMQHKNPDIKIKQVALFNWQFVDLEDTYKPDGKTLDFLNENFYSRLQNFITKYKPDTVLLCGVGMFNWVYNKITNKFNKGLSNRLNQILKVKIKDHKFSLVGTIELYKPTSWDQKYTKEYPPLLGYIGKAIITALEGYNRYNIKLSKKEDINFFYIHTIEQFDTFYKKLCKKSVISIDLEGKNLAKLANVLYSAQFCWSNNSAYFVPLYHPDTPFTDTEVKYIIRKLKHYFEFGISEFHIYQNGKFDISVMHGQFGIRYYNHKIFDIQGGQFAIDENIKGLSKFSSLVYGKIRPYSLDFIAEQYGCRVYSKTAVSKADRANLAAKHLPSKKELANPKYNCADNGFVVYGGYDVLIPFHLAKMQVKVAQDFGQSKQKFMNFVTEQLSDTTLAFAQMEFTGAKIDKKELYALNKPDGKLAKAIEDQIAWFQTSKAARKVNAYLCKKRGVPETNLWNKKDTWLFKINKPAHQQLLFFKSLKLEAVADRKDGGGKVDKKFQKKFATVDEVKVLTELKKLGIIKSTFVNALINQLENDPDASIDFRVRSNYLYITVVTGRISSTKPNRQNIPARGPLAKMIKRLDIAQEEMLLIDNDYSANEIREWANESGDKNIVGSFLVGLQLRQKIRSLSYKNPLAALNWSQIKKNKKWAEIKGTAEEITNQKNAIIKCIKNTLVRKIAEIEFDLELNGDIHKNNASLFFNTPVLEITDTQRYDIKALVFGTVYGKTAGPLGMELGKDENYGKYLQDTLFAKFPVAAKFLTDAHEFGQKNLMVESPLGMQRHLWAYLHNRQAVINGQNRRGPNSILQGVASQIGVMSIRIMQNLIWHYFVKYKVPMHWKAIINFVHDSLKSEAPYVQVPIYLYLMEHASTTLIHRRLLEVFGYKLSIGLELEFGLGATMSHSEKFNFMPDNLLETMRKEMQWQKEEFGYKVDFTKLNMVKHNWDIVAGLRLKELVIDSKSKEPAKTMLLTEKNARSLELIF